MLHSTDCHRQNTCNATTTNAKRPRAFFVATVALLLLFSVSLWIAGGTTQSLRQRQHYEEEEVTSSSVVDTSTIAITSSSSSMFSSSSSSSASHGSVLSISSLLPTTTTTTTTMMRTMLRRSFASLSSASSPFKPKKLHHGTVQYLTEDIPGEPHSRQYQRKFTIPCGYGLLVFNIGPAADNLPYTFDLYDDAYVYSNNQGLCLLYPSYRGYQTGDDPFWIPEQDPTLQTIPLGHALNRISHKINPQSIPTKSNLDPNAVAAHGGDYAIIAKGDFYDPRYYQELRALVNGWPGRQEQPQQQQEVQDEKDHWKLLMSEHLEEWVQSRSS